MTETRYRGNVGIIAVLILILFVASALTADPASSTPRAGGSDLAGTTTTTPPTTTPPTTTPKTSTPKTSAGAIAATPVTAIDPVRGSGDLKVQQPSDGYRLDAKPIGRPGGLTTGGGQHGTNHCFIDFNDPVIISTLPFQASTGVVEWPFWGQYCAYPQDVAIKVNPVGEEHYHLNYVNEDLRWCTDLGDFGMPLDPADLLSNCSPIDPTTEPREAVQPHYQNLAIRVFAYQPATGDRVQFNLNQLRVLGGDAEVCFVRTDLPWITSKPTDQPAGYCGDLEPGYWDISASVTDAFEVRLYSRSPNTSFTDIGINSL